MIDIIIFAIMAFVIGVKFFNILGQENDQDPSNNKANKNVISLKETEYENVTNISNNNDELEEKALLNLSNENQELIKQIKNINNSFLTYKFLKNSEKAFEIIINAFAQNDTKTLKSLTSDKIYKNFTSQIDKISKAKQTLNVNLVAIIKNQITDISLNKNIARITLDIVSEQITSITDQEGKIIKGDNKTIEEINDNWVFEKNLKTKNPVWLLVETQN